MAIGSTEIFGPEDAAPGSLIPSGTDDLSVMTGMNANSNQLLDDIKSTIRNHCTNGFRNAVSLSQDVKSKWAKYHQMKMGVWQDDFQDDPLVELGVHQQYLARHIDTLKSVLLNDLIPDPATMDWFHAESHFGMGAYGDGITQLLREKFKRMRPEDSENFVDWLDRELDDWLTLGNLCSIVTHEMLSGSDGDMVFQGACVQWIDPFNVWPWRTDINTMSQVDTTIFAPVTEEELHQGTFFNKEQIFERVAPGSWSKRDPLAESSGHSQGYHEPLYSRYVDFIRIPWRKIISQLSETYEGITEEVLIDVLSQEFGFDPATAVSPNTWWNIERIGDELAHCRPYPLVLPAGRSPILHVPMFKTNASVWGNGIYDRGHWDEVFKNFYHRALIRLSSINADPPIGFFPDMIDPEWLAEHDEKAVFEPSQHIPLVPGAPQQKPFAELAVNPQALPMLAERGQYHEEQMRDLTGANSSIEGRDKSRTATQNSNNLTMSLSLTSAWEKTLENVFLREILLRTYTVTQQAMLTADITEIIPGGADLQMLRMMVVTPEQMVDLNLLDFKMTARLKSPGNRLQLIQALREFIQTWLPTGLLSLPQAMREHAKALDIPAWERMLLQMSPEEISMVQQNLSISFMGQGPAGPGQETNVGGSSVPGGGGVKTSPSGPSAGPQLPSVNGDQRMPG